MPASVLSKDSKIQEMQNEQKQLLLVVAPVAGTASDASIVAISGALSARAVAIDLKEPVLSVQKLQIVNRATGQSVALASAPVISGNTVTATFDGTGITSACIELSFKA